MWVDWPFLFLFHISFLKIWTCDIVVSIPACWRLPANMLSIGFFSVVSDGHPKHNQAPKTPQQVNIRYGLSKEQVSNFLLLTAKVCWTFYEWHMGQGCWLGAGSSMVLLMYMHAHTHTLVFILWSKLCHRFADVHACTYAHTHLHFVVKTLS